MKRLSTLWTKHLRDKDAKESLEKAIRNSVPALERLTDIITELEYDIYVSESKEESYSGDWAYLQAHRNGKKETLRLIKNLVDLDN